MTKLTDRPLMTARVDGCVDCVDHCVEDRVEHCADDCVDCVDCCVDDSVDDCVV